MTLSLKSIGQQALIIVGVATIWVLFFRLNDLLFSGVAHSEWAHWIFIPAAIRVIALLLFDGAGVVGLVLGAYFTLRPGDADHVQSAILLPLSSGLAPWVAVGIWRRTFGIERNLAGLPPRDIAALSIGCAVMNSVLLNLYLTLSGEMPGDVEQIATVAVGDALGTALVLSLMSLLLAMPARSVRTRR